MASFSERNGYAPARAIQLESMDARLRNAIWNCISDFRLYKTEAMLRDDHNLLPIATSLQDEFHGLSLELLPTFSSEFIDEEHTWFQKDASWSAVYDYCEFVAVQIEGDHHRFASALNLSLEREKSGYRLIDDQIVPITAAHEIAEIDRAADQTDTFAGAAEHIKTALRHYAHREAPDYRNAIKEAISAVEWVARIVSGNPKATLGDAIKAIKLKKTMHPAFADAMIKLYGYTSDADGLRHALVGTDTADEVDARFMLITCSAFVNYMISRA